MKIAIIGAGWSGLSCAEKLISTNPEIKITIYEASTTIGGRAKGLTWKLSDNRELLIDNGQHLVIGAYTHFLKLLERSNAPKWFKQNFSWTYKLKKNNFISKEKRFFVKQTYKKNNLFNSFYLFKNVSFKWKLQFLIALINAKYLNWNFRGNVKTWLIKNYQSKDIIKFFWIPFVESTLNTSWNEASANALLTVIKECLREIPESISIYFPPNNLTYDAVNPVVNHLKNLGVIFSLNSPVKLIENNLSLKIRSVLTQEYDKIIIATPSYAAKKIWSASNFTEKTNSFLWENQEYRSIFNLWVVLPKHYKAETVKNNTTNWEIIVDENHDNNVFYVVIDRPDKKNGITLSIVRSAININDSNQNLIISEEMINFTNIYLKNKFNVRFDDCESKFIKEKRATFACLENFFESQKNWSNPLTNIKNIYKCSDDSTTNFPATIESAVRSGSKTANHILNEIKFNGN